jgi:O-antigen biosynthesis protein
VIDTSQSSIMSEPVCIGVVVHSDVAGVTDTVRMARAHTDSDVRIVLLPDGPDAAMAEALISDPELAGLEQWGTSKAQGMAACFNRLASRSRADVVVLLESGVLVGPRWLDLLLGALRRPGCGLAGPSTNSAWNEQAIAGRGGSDAASIRHQAARALSLFGHAARTLEPLYSLADFCYAVRREVIDAIGLAEEGYGVGPCWEMDYNVRAARAGFKGVWVGTAFVYRPAPSERRREGELRRFEINRQLYQDRLCGLRLRGETSLYRPHCLGDECEHFAPAALLPEPTPPPAAPGRASDSAENTVARAAADRPTHPCAPASKPPPAQLRPVAPLVSCIMPTRGRPDFVRQAVRYFQRQDYPNTELLIIEDGTSELADALPQDSRIRLIAIDTTRSIGALRNIACQHARGEIIVQWDDDDWHGPLRLSRQVAPIRSGAADITALRDAVMFDLQRWEFWKFSAELHKRMFVRDVHGGTLAFRRSVWERMARYPDRSLAEDAAFLDKSIRGGARLQAIPADGLFVYLRHSTNSWQLSSPTAGGWQACPEPALPAADRDYYAQRSPAAPAPAYVADQPLVSAIMPTMDRRPFVAQSIDYFMRQDYPAKELIVLDDGHDSVQDLIPDDPSVVYRRLPQRVVLGAKRNLACDLGRGSVIVHWDDDDWQAPDRLSIQVNRMLRSGSDLCGSRAIHYYDPSTGRAFRYQWPAGGRIWAAGPSLCYSRELWLSSPFPEVATGEDSRFVWSRAVKSMCDVSDADSVVAIIHSNNTVMKAVHGLNWSNVPSTRIVQLLSSDLAFYAELVDPCRRS